MRRFYQKTFFVLLLGLLQLLIPVFSGAGELPCNERGANDCVNAPCCQPEPSLRLVCCNQPVRATPAAAPARLDKPSRALDDLITPIQFVESGCGLAPTPNADKNFSSCNTPLANNQRYKLLATFLI